MAIPSRVREGEGVSSKLAAVSDRAWDNLGVLVGVLACSTIGYQVLQEWRTPVPSSVSIWFVVGFLLVYMFWFLYGIRFGRRGIWLPNAVAAMLQVLFAIAVLAKG
jgi:uncharacterized protein with PQ loop repeat